jgi:hypothetical protein
MASNGTNGRVGFNGWAKFFAGILLGCGIPGLIAWGAMGNQIQGNSAALSDKVDVAVFVEYKEGLNGRLTLMCDALDRIEARLGTHVKEDTGN